jgi:tRNA/tmRNA/rRNA uracil-C5-methylase (TrmA/RlmC/RlmD family)
VGTIGLYVANKASSLTGIELVAPAIELAKRNKEENGVENAVFFTSDMKNILDYTPLEVQTLIVDPPRAGLGKKVIKRINELEPEKIIYMSCNPKTQKIDFDYLEGYEVVSLKAYDQFPHTPHIETLAILKKIAE